MRWVCFCTATKESIGAARMPFRWSVDRSGSKKEHGKCQSDAYSLHFVLMIIEQILDPDYQCVQYALKCMYELACLPWCLNRNDMLARTQNRCSQCFLSTSNKDHDWGSGSCSIHFSLSPVDSADSDVLSVFDAAFLKSLRRRRQCTVPY